MLHEEGCNQRIWFNNKKEFKKITYNEFKTKEYLIGEQK
jgi:hypothetical protein